MAKSRIIEVNEKIAEGVAAGYRKMEKGAAEGETIEEAKEHLQAGQRGLES